MNCLGCERPATADDIDDVLIGGDLLRQEAWRCTDCHEVKRTADWDVDGLTVSCKACEDDQCDDCLEVAGSIDREATRKALAMYGRPYPGWTVEHENPSVELRQEWLRLKGAR